MRDNQLSEEERRIIQAILGENPLNLTAKAHTYALYHAGILGNKALTWSSYEEILRSGWKGKVCMRSRKGIDRKKVKYNLTLEKTKEEILKWEAEGISRESITFNQAMPDENLVIQGEVMHGLYDLDLTYSTIKKPMNLALIEKPKIATGIEARVLLRDLLWAPSYSDIETLLCIFPDHVVEFSAYDTPVGNLPGRNAVIWEVRNY
jgi:hypothetical protein